MTWDDYVSAVEGSPYHSLNRRLALLREAHTIMNKVSTFSELSLEERKAIAGVVGRNERLGGDLDNFDWGWFCSMFGAGSFSNRIGENDLHLSNALECIPPTGDITSDDYNEFIEQFLLAFEAAARQGGVPTTSRLLAMKRPDYFVCIDNRNKHKLCDDLGFAKSNLNFETYWTEIIEPITQANWWQARRPTGVNGQIWDGRVAMLDAIYYEPNEH